MRGGSASIFWNKRPWFWNWRPSFSIPTSTFLILQDILLTKKRLLLTLKCFSVTILKTKIPKFFSPRFARRQGHIGPKIFYMESGGPKLAYFFHETISESSWWDQKYFSFIKYVLYLLFFALNLSYISDRKFLYLLFSDSKMRGSPVFLYLYLRIFSLDFRIWFFL